MEILRDTKKLFILVVTTVIFLFILSSCGDGKSDTGSGGALPDCGVNQVLLNGLCEDLQCPIGQEAVNGACQAIQCPVGQILEDGVCVQPPEIIPEEPEPEEPEPEEPEPPAPTPMCPSNSSLLGDNTTCECDSGYRKAADSNSCIAFVVNASHTALNVTVNSNCSSCHLVTFPAN